MLQVPEGEEPPPPAPEPVVEEDEEEGEEKEREVWNAYTTVKGLSVSVSGLKEGKRYKFRVAAKNIIGCSTFTETREASEIKEQIRESPSLASTCFLFFQRIFIFFLIQHGGFILLIQPSVFLLLIQHGVYLQWSPRSSWLRW